MFSTPLFVVTAASVGGGGDGRLHRDWQCDPHDEPANYWSW
jgi:hypothetical protein